MNLSELIAAYGDERVTFQKIDDCLMSADMMTPVGTKLTIVTTEALHLDGMEKMGLVVWLDRKRVAEIVAAEKAER